MFSLQWTVPRRCRTSSLSKNRSRTALSHILPVVHSNVRAFYWFSRRFYEGHATGCHPSCNSVPTSIPTWLLYEHIQIFNKTNNEDEATSSCHWFVFDWIGHDMNSLLPDVERCWLVECSYALPNINSIMKWRRMGWVRYAPRITDNENACKVLVGKREGITRKV